MFISVLGQAGKAAGSSVLRVQLLNYPQLQLAPASQELLGLAFAFPAANLEGKAKKRPRSSLASPSGRPEGE